ncbi:hypothetical protein MRB53_035591 [Persea americana]|uniref:Uncharacterized protein n=1 Tax=Persea americana TaxID=3435 RepID=A0ACC2K532_PERAE|nr:hypothetical protein MRB53_035591 [Persea americana]
MRFGKDEKLKLLRSPCKPAPGRLISSMLPASSHLIPIQLHGVVLLVLESDHDCRLCAWRLDFHERRASACASAVDNPILQETKIAHINSKMMALDLCRSMVLVHDFCYWWWLCVVGKKKKSQTCQPGKGVFAPSVILTHNIIGKKRFNQLRGKAIALHSQVITEFCKSIGADGKQRQGLIRLAKKNGEWLGFLA